MCATDSGSNNKDFIHSIVFQYFIFSMPVTGLFPFAKILTLLPQNTFINFIYLKKVIFIHKI